MHRCGRINSGCRRPRLRVNMDPIKTTRYGSLLLAVAAIAGAYFEAKSGNKLLALKLLTTATLSIGVSLRPDVFVKNAKGSGKYIIGFLVIMAILGALAAFRIFDRALFFRIIPPVSRGSRTAACLSIPHPLTYPGKPRCWSDSQAWENQA